MRNQQVCFEFDPEDSFMTTETHRKADQSQKQKMNAYPKLLQWQIRARVKGVY